MEITKSLKITKIILDGFRCHKDNTVINADDITLINGDNGKGKSSVAHGVAYALYGVSAFGVQDIDNIRNTAGDTVSVTLEFTDERGITHSFNRTRKNDDTTLTMDGNIILQKHIDSIFCDKDLFLSIFNPSYFVEVLGAKGKELLALRLPIVKKEEVLAKLTKTEQELLKALDLAVPEIVLQKLKNENKDLNEKSISVDGQLVSVSEDIIKYKSKKGECVTELNDIEQKLSALTEKKNAGINVDDLNTEKLLIQDKLSQNNDNSRETLYNELIVKMTKAQERVFTPANNQELADIAAELKSLSKQFYEVKERTQKIKSGDVCPTCYITITDSNINSVKENLAEKLRQIQDIGKNIQGNLTAKNEVNKKLQEDFENRRNEYIEMIKNQIEDLKVPETDANQTLVTRLTEIDDLLRVGNLSDEEYNDLVCLEMDKKTSETMLGVLNIEEKEDSYKNLLTRQSEIEVKIKSNSELIKAVQEYTAKRSEIALSSLKMPNVKIKFYEIVRTTGELKNCFKFMYNGYDYNTLSLSEKIKAGIEIAYMLRNLTGYNYPIFIDNSESIGDFDSNLLPEQSFFMRFIKGAEFTVKSKHIPKESKEQQKAA